MRTARLGDSGVQVTYTVRNEVTNEREDLTAFDVFTMQVKDPNESVTTIAAVSGGSLGEVDATVPEFNIGGTWYLRPRLTDTGSGAQRTGTWEPIFVEP